MRRVFAIALALAAATALALAVSSSFGSSSRQGKTGPLKVGIESWLYASPSASGLAGTVKACFKLTGALADQGGKPAWADGSAYIDVKPATACGDWTPVGGFSFTPPLSQATLYAVHTITGAKGQLFVTFAGVYDLAKTFQGHGTWVITGGTDAYKGVTGEGVWDADATSFPYIRHTETGHVHLPT